jgi:hypothetical protein
MSSPLSKENLCKCPLELGNTHNQPHRLVVVLNNPGNQILLAAGGCNVI